MPKIQKFRFLELVAVVGLLLVLLWGIAEMFQGARSKGSPIMCSGHLKQLGSAGSLYADDNAGSLPGPQPWGPAIPEVSWDKPLARQMGASIQPGELLLPERMFGCTHPARITLRTFTCPQDPDASASWITARSYSENLGDGLSATGIEPTADKIPVKKLIFTAGTVFLMENQGGATAFGAANAANDTWIGLSTPDAMYEANPHRKDFFLFSYFTGHFDSSFSMVRTVRQHLKGKTAYTNVLMYDGHVESLSKDDLSRSKSEFLKYDK